jgi:hypothetical protein
LFRQLFKALILMLARWDGLVAHVCGFAIPLQIARTSIRLMQEFRYDSLRAYFATLAPGCLRLRVR